MGEYKMEKKIQITEQDITVMVNEAVRLIKESGFLGSRKRGQQETGTTPAPDTAQTTPNFDKMTFNQAFQAARDMGKPSFYWRDKCYMTIKKGENKVEWQKALAQNGGIIGLQQLPKFQSPAVSLNAGTLAGPSIITPKERKNTEANANESGIMEMTMTRIGFYGKRTLSTLEYTTAEGKPRKFPVIEDVDRGLSLKFDNGINNAAKEHSETAIPEGVYNVKLHCWAGKNFINKHNDGEIAEVWKKAKGYPWLQIGEEHTNGVFQGVLMHQGTSEGWSSGCLIIGGAGKDLSEKFSLDASVEGTCVLLEDTIPFQSGRLTIKRTEGEFLDFSKDENNILAKNKHKNAFNQYHQEELAENTINENNFKNPLDRVRTRYIMLGKKKHLEGDELRQFVNDKMSDFMAKDAALTDFSKDLHNEHPDEEEFYSHSRDMADAYGFNDEPYYDEEEY